MAMAAAVAGLIAFGVMAWRASHTAADARVDDVNADRAREAANAQLQVTATELAETRRRYKAHTAALEAEIHELEDLLLDFDDRDGTDPGRDRVVSGLRAVVSKARTRARYDRASGVLGEIPARDVSGAADDSHD
jgi:hypothetical protein